MKRVYLDQNKWIDLAAARTGLAKGEPYVDVLAVARAGVERGLLSFPLSSVHYMETTNRRKWESRRELAATMALLSAFHTIAPQSQLVPPELDRTFNRFFGRPTELRALRPFGIGVAHAFDSAVEPYRVPHDLALPEGARWTIERQAQRFQEWALLAAPPLDDDEALEGYDPTAHLPIARAYAEDQEKLRALRTTEGWNSGERAGRVAKAAAFVNSSSRSTTCFNAREFPPMPSRLSAPTA